MGIPRLKVVEYLCFTLLTCVTFGMCKTVPTKPDKAAAAGLKLLVDDDLLSFDTSLCSGGIFFKRPVLVQMTCVHGYYLARPSGCSMEGSRVLTGKNYECHLRHDSEPGLIQAIIPLTNPEHPLDHTIILYDDPRTLKNFRRYSVDKIKAGKYEQSGSEPAGVIVANSQKMSKVVNIDKLCYNGKSREPAVSYMATLQRPKNRTEDLLIRSNLVDSGCNNDSMEFPWGTESTYKFSRGFSDPDLKDVEVIARLPKSAELSNNASEREKLEIWEGLAYCLQTKEILKDGRIKLGGLEPSLESLEKFCSTRPMTKMGVRSKRHYGRRWPPIFPPDEGGIWGPWPPPGEGGPWSPWRRRTLLPPGPWPPWRPPPIVPWDRR